MSNVPLVSIATLVINGERHTLFESVVSQKPCHHCGKDTSHFCIRCKRNLCPTSSCNVVKNHDKAVVRRETHDGGGFRAVDQPLRDVSNQDGGQTRSLKRKQVFPVPQNTSEATVQAGRHWRNSIGMLHHSRPPMPKMRQVTIPSTSSAKSTASASAASSMAAVGPQARLISCIYCKKMGGTLECRECHEKRTKHRNQPPMIQRRVVVQPPEPPGRLPDLRSIIEQDLVHKLGILPGKESGQCVQCGGEDCRTKCTTCFEIQHDGCMFEHHEDLLTRCNFDPKQRSLRVFCGKIRIGGVVHEISEVTKNQKCAYFLCPDLHRDYSRGYRLNTCSLCRPAITLHKKCFVYYHWRRFKDKQKADR